MGEVFKPESLAKKRKAHIPDITPKPVKPPTSTPITLETVYQEIRYIREELMKIKQVLRKYGIHIK